MKDRHGLLGLALIAMLSCAGCMNMIVPKTKITGTIGGQPFSVVSPKDSTLKGLNVAAQADGSVTIAIEALEAKMNPDVITTTATGQVDLINAVSAALQQAMASGAKAAAK